MAGGNLPYGYTRNDKYISKNPREVEIITVIYMLSKSENTEREIAIKLNESEYTRRNGTPWTQRTISAILSRELLYREGFIRYGKIQGKNSNLAIL